MGQKKMCDLLTSIPPAVRPIVTRRNTLSGENPEEYEDFLVGLSAAFTPVVTRQLFASMATSCWRTVWPTSRERGVATPNEGVTTRSVA